MVSVGQYVDGISSTQLQKDHRSVMLESVNETKADRHELTQGTLDFLDLLSNIAFGNLVRCQKWVFPS